MKILSLLSSIFFMFILQFMACMMNEPSNPVAVTNDMFPPAPQNIVATIGDRNIVLSWKMSDSCNISKYYIFRGDASNQESLLIDSSIVQTYTNKFLDNGVEYFYQISAINLEGYQGPRSAPIKAIPGLYSFIINNGEQYTDSISVSLTFVVPGTVSLVKISNDSLFKNAIWEPFINPRIWMLNGSDGIKTVYIKFRDELGNESSKPATNSIILDRNAHIILVTEDTNGEVKTFGDTIHFTLISNEINGSASINIGDVTRNVNLYDDGTYGDLKPYDGCYEVDYIITQDITAVNALVTGFFIDQFGNVALPVSASGRITIKKFLNPVNVFDPVVDSRSIYLSWSQNNDGEFSSYRIYRSKKLGVNFNSLTIKVISDRTTNYYLDENLEYSTTYYYRVYVYDNNGQSIGSGEVSATTDPNTVPAPVILAVPSLINDTTLRLSWTQNNEDDFAAYYIFRSESPPVDTTANPIMIINTQTITSYNDLNLARDTQFYYRVFVYDEGGLCAGSEEVSGKTAP